MRCIELLNCRLSLLPSSLSVSFLTASSPLAGVLLAHTYWARWRSTLFRIRRHIHSHSSTFLSACLAAIVFTPLPFRHFGFPSPFSFSLLRSSRSAMFLHSFLLFLLPYPSLRSRWVVQRIANRSPTYLPFCFASSVKPTQNERNNEYHFILTLSSRLFYSSFVLEELLSCGFDSQCDSYVIHAFLELGGFVSRDDLDKRLCEGALGLRLSRHSVVISMT